MNVYPIVDATFLGWVRSGAEIIVSASSAA